MIGAYRRASITEYKNNLKDLTIMKIKYLRTLVRFRKYANTRKGEKVVVRTLTVLSCVLLVDVSLLIIGSIL